MKIAEIKQNLDLETLLSCIGCEPDPKKSKGADLWYKSPFRSTEKMPSFHINTRHDIYKDFGSGEEGGDLIHFAVKYTQHLGLNSGASVKEALPWLREFLNRSDAFEKPPSKSNDDEVETDESITKVFNIIEDKPIFITSLLQNLKDRKLSVEIAKHYLRQIKYSRPTSPKEYYGFGFRNRAGDIEFSNPIPFKTVLGHKDISFIKGTNCEHLEVFEGVWDFLTRLSIEGHTKPLNDCLVLNSIHLHSQVSQLIKSNSYRSLSLWLDNDKAGHQTYDRIFENLPEALEAETHKMNAIYEGFKDLNAWHVDSSLSPSDKRLLIHQALQPRSGLDHNIPHHFLD